MATLHPFPALRPKPEFVEEVACVPYDVINTEEARHLAHGKSFSFLHVIRPEIDLPEGTDEHDDAVYETGAANLRRFADSDVFEQENEPALYVYRLIMDGRAQTGLFGCVSVKEYDDDTILKHEKTRPDKEDDRTRHILTQQAHAEPVMLTYRNRPKIDALVDQVTTTSPLYDFTADDGVQHTVWRVTQPQAMSDAFKDVPHLYVADGHHRCKAASRTAEAMHSSLTDTKAEFEFFPAVLFPMNQMHIMAYNRILYDVPGRPAEFLAALKQRFVLNPDAPPAPQEKGDVSIYMDGTWYGLTLPKTQRGSVVDHLDVARLGEFILEPMLNITNPRTDPNIYFVGGIRGTKALERLVNAGKAQMAISMYPTSIEELLAVSDDHLLMPPKSTWFEPKLRSGLLIHLF